MSNRNLKVKINNTTSSWTDLIKVVLQWSALRPLLFNIYLHDLFFTLKNIDNCNFADDTTPYICNNSIEKFLNLLGKNIELALCWFENKYTKLNIEKCDLIA